MQMQAPGHCRRGKLIATALAGIWRSAQPSLSLTAEEFADIVPCLLETGAAAPGWQRVRQAGWSILPPVFRELRDACRLHTLRNAIHVKHLTEVLGRFHDAGLDPLLVKGWSLARLYSEPDLRPYGDIDLCVPPEQMPVAVAILTKADGKFSLVDLHQGVADLDGRPWQQVWQRSRSFPLGSRSVRVLGAEDQLRHLCLHLMRHGAFRPLWLCDVGAALESRPANFDWTYCLSGDRCFTDWVVCALGLANQLLDSRIDEPIVAARATKVPEWLVASVLHQWGLGQQSRNHIPVADYLRQQGRGIRAALRDRWHNLNLVEVFFHWRLNPFRRAPAWLRRCAAMLARLEQYVVRRLRKTPMQTDVVDRPFEVHPQRATYRPWATG